MPDDYHPHYPTTDKDYYHRLVNLAGLLFRAEQAGIKVFFMFGLPPQLQEPSSKFLNIIKV